MFAFIGFLFCLVVFFALGAASVVALLYFKGAEIIERLQSEYPHLLH